MWMSQMKGMDMWWSPWICIKSFLGHMLFPQENLSLKVIAGAYCYPARSNYSKCFTCINSFNTPRNAISVFVRLLFPFYRWKDWDLGSYVAVKYYSVTMYQHWDHTKEVTLSTPHCVTSLCYRMWTMVKGRNMMSKSPGSHKYLESEEVDLLTPFPENLFYNWCG